MKGILHMKTKIIHTKVNPDFFADKGVWKIDDFFKFLVAYKKTLLSSIQNPHMDDEIILLSAEGYIEEIFHKSSEDTKKVMIEICNDYLDYNICEHRAWIYVSHLINQGNNED